MCMYPVLDPDPVQRRGLGANGAYSGISCATGVGWYASPWAGRRPIHMTAPSSLLSNRGAVVREVVPPVAPCPRQVAAESTVHVLRPLWMDSGSR